MNHVPARLSTLLLLLAVNALGGCESHADSVCEDIGDCAQGGAYEFITACQTQAQTLATQASASGCAAQYNDYNACANNNFTCTGITPSFPGCQASLSSLEACLAAGEAKNACGMLDTALAACPGEPDGGAGDAGVPPAPCTDGGVCEAQCYLDSLDDVCTPTPAGLDAFSQCASQCTF